MTVTEHASLQVPVLRQNLMDLMDLSSKALASPIRIPRGSHLRFMLASFAAKQLEHGSSLLKLESSIDTVLIARSMLEGLAQLLWAMKQPRRRPLMWRAFTFVLDLRLLDQYSSQGLTVDPETKRHIDQGIRRYGNLFLTEKAKSAVLMEMPPPKDPFRRNWYTGSEMDIFREIDVTGRLEAAYSLFSEWHHWRPGSFGRVLSFHVGSDTFRMTPSDPSQLAMSLAVGFQCVWQTMQLYNARCRLGIGHKLQRLNRRQLMLAHDHGDSASF